MNNKPIIGISIGDINGIGIEIIIKTFSDSRMLELCTPVIFASNKVINFYKKTMVTETIFNYTSIKNFQQINHKQVNVFNCWEEDVTIQPGVLNPIGGKYAVRSLTVATQCLKDKEIDALVTAPLHKSNVKQHDFDYTGHTPFLKAAFDAKDVVMMLYRENFRVALATEHVSIENVAKNITKDNIESKLQIIHDTLIKDFGVEKPKIAVLGLNPHAGDEGLIGKEEKEIITPVINAFNEKGHLVYGPYSADTFFSNGKQYKFDAVLAMYHDQGLIPFKTLCQAEGVNYTCGLPVIRTSPDHGTAFDIAGRDLADPTSFREAVFQAIDLLRNRESYLLYTKNPLQKTALSKER